MFFVSFYGRCMLSLVVSAVVVSAKPDDSIIEHLDDLLTSAIKDNQDLETNIHEAQRIVMNPRSTRPDPPLVELVEALDLLTKAKGCNHQVINTLAYFLNSSLEDPNGERRIHGLFLQIVAKFAQDCEAFIENNITNMHKRLPKTALLTISQTGRFRIERKRQNYNNSGPDWDSLLEGIPSTKEIEVDLEQVARDDPLFFSYKIVEDPLTGEEVTVYQMAGKYVETKYVIEPCLRLYNMLDSLVKALFVIKCMKSDEEVRGFLDDSSPELVDSIRYYLKCTSIAEGYSLKL